MKPMGVWWCRVLFAASFFALLLPSLLIAQTAATGALSGTVTDPTGAVIPNATVTVTSADTGQVRTATTGSDGSYKIGLLPPGDYRVKFQAAGFEATEIPAATVTVTETGTLNEALKVGAQTQEVTVQSNVEAVQTSNATVGTVVGSETVTALPLSTRNYVNLLGLSAGTNAAVQNASLAGKGTQAIAVNGSSTAQNAYLMDGVAINSFNTGGGVGESGTEMFVGIPNPDAIGEFKIQTSQYDASYGRNPGANVNVVTKGGTNEYHGDVWEFLRNRALNANEFFLKHSEVCGVPGPTQIGTTSVPAGCIASPAGIYGGTRNNLPGVLTQNQIGGTLGGPIKKDKLFFFISYQETRQINGISSGASNPTLPYIPSGNRGPICPTTDTTFAACEAADTSGATTTFVNSLLAGYCNEQGKPSGGSAPNGFVIAPSGACSIAAPTGVLSEPLNPVALRILQLKLPNGNYYIPANGSAATQQSSPYAGTLDALTSPVYYEEHQMVGNWDYVINSKNTLTGRYFYSIDPTALSFPNGATSLVGFPDTQTFSNHEAVLKLTTIVSNTLVNEARASFQRNVANDVISPPFTASELGITPVIPALNLMPAISIGGTAFSMGTYNFGITTSLANQFQVADQISWEHGKQTIRAGFEAERIQWNWTYPGLAIGNYSYNTFQDFLIGLPGCTATGPGPKNAACQTQSQVENGGLVTGSSGDSNGNGNISTVSGTTTRPIGNTLLTYYRTRDFDAFVQDDIKLNQKLTINLGLRWEYDGITSELNGKNTNIWQSLAAAGPMPLLSAANEANTAVLNACRFSSTNTLCPGSNLFGFVVPANYPTGKYPAPLEPGVFQNRLNIPSENSTPLDNFGPRFGFAWQPLSSSKLVVRGGAGFFYDRASGEDTIHSAEQSVPYSITIGGTGSGLAASDQLPFNPEPPGWSPRWYTADGKFSSNISQTSVNQHYVTPLVYEWNLNTQYEFAPRWVLEVGYVGSRGIHQVDSQPINVAPLATPGNPINCGYDGVPTDCITSNASTGANSPNVRVPLLGFAPGYAAGESTGGDFKFNSLQATLRKQLSHGLSLQAAYTFSKAFVSSFVYNPLIFTGAGYTTPNEPNTPIVRVYIPNTAYRPNRLTFNFDYNLPFGHPGGLLGKLAEGWNFSGVTTIQGGTPLTITDTGGTDIGGGGTALAQLKTSATGKCDSLGFCASTVPILTTGSTYSKVVASLNNTGGYLTNAPYVSISSAVTGGLYGTGTGSGNSAFGPVLGPGQDNWDMALVKTTVVGGLRESATLQFRAEFFNTFNHPQFSNPSATFNANGALMGHITSTAVNPRLIQFALKYAF